MICLQEYSFYLLPWKNNLVKRNPIFQSNNMLYSQEYSVQLRTSKEKSFY